MTYYEFNLFLPKMEQYFTYFGKISFNLKQV